MTDTTLSTVVDDMPELEYHAHPALSSSGARKLLPPYCPALFKWDRDHPPLSKPQFDMGHGAHLLVLGKGDPIARLDFDNWMTKASKEARQAAYDAGEVPLLAKDHDTVLAMAEAIRVHPVAGPLFNPDNGQAEQSFFWHDARYGIDRRARLDWLTFQAADGRPIIVDYKTAVSADPAAFAKAVANYGYHQQHAWYVDGLEACLGDLADEPFFVFVVQEKNPPYLVTLIQLDADTVRIGRAKNEQAMEVYADCSAHDVWPGYSDDIELIGLPAWADRQYL